MNLEVAATLRRVTLPSKNPATVGKDTVNVRVRNSLYRRLTPRSQPRQLVGLKLQHAQASMGPILPPQGAGGVSLLSARHVARQTALP